MWKVMEIPPREWHIIWHKSCVLAAKQVSWMFIPQQSFRLSLLCGTCVALCGTLCSTLCEEFTSHRWIPLTKASDAELWCFLWTNGLVNNRGAGDLRRHRAHYCPACRTYEIATRFWVVVICPIIKIKENSVFIHHNFQFYFELCTYCNILDIYLS